MIRTLHREYDYERRQFVEVWRTWDPERLAYRKVDSPPVMVRGFDFAGFDAAAARVMAEAARATADSIGEFVRGITRAAELMVMIKFDDTAFQRMVDDIYIEIGADRYPPRYDPRHLYGWPNYAEASPPEGSRWTPWGYTGMPDGWHGKGND